MLVIGAIMRGMAAAAEYDPPAGPPRGRPLAMSVEDVKSIAHKLPRRGVDAPKIGGLVVIRRDIPVFIDQPDAVQRQPEADGRTDLTAIGKGPIPFPLPEE